MNLPLLILSVLSFCHLSTQIDVLLPDSLDSSCKGFTITSSSTKFSYTTNSGDINGDQIPDIIISDYQYPNPSTLYVIYGTKIPYKDFNVDTMTSQEGFKITNLKLFCNDNPHFISTAGDVDGDGIVDIVIGASDENAVYVVYGKKGGYLDFDITSLTDDKGYAIIGPSSRFGWNVNSKADVNGDKINDIIVGSKSGSGSGFVFVVYGQKARGSTLTAASMPTTRGFKISGASPAFLGAAVSNAGDFNKDGIDDFLITAPGISSYLGASYVVYGNSGLTSSYSYTTFSTSKVFTITAASPAYKLALAASDAGDFNNDGVSDILLGAYDSMGFKGLVYVVYGKKGGPTDFVTSNMDTTQGMAIAGISANDLLGSSLASIGDINGDGISDIFIGAKGFSSGKGTGYIIYGMKNPPLQLDLSTLTPVQGFKISGSLTSGLVGASAANLGDINQDGLSDIIIGSPGTNQAYVLFGPNGWACDICGSSSTCKKCESGSRYTFDGRCYQECPIYAPIEIGSQCFSEIPEQISPGMKGGVTKGATGTTVTNKVLNLWSPSDAFPFIYGQLKASVMYFRYLNITRTQKLEELYQLFYDTDTNVVPFVSMSDGIKDAFPSENLPYMFRKYSLPSGFLANFGDDFMGLFIIFLCLVTTKLASFMVKKWIRNLPSLRRVLQRISFTLQNFFMGSFAELLSPIIFYSTMEFRNRRDTEKEYYVTSLLACVLSIILGLTALIICGWVLNKFRIVRKAFPQIISPQKQKKTFELLEKKYEGFGVFFAEFDNSSLFQQSAFLLFSFRSVTESFIVALFFEYPLLQAILLAMLTFLLLAYIVIKRPFKNKLALAQQLVLILSLFFCNLCLALMAGTDLTYKSFESIKENTSQVIFWALVMFQFIPLLFFAIGLGESAWKLYKWFSLLRSPNSRNLKIKTKRPSGSSLFSLDQSLDQSRTHLTNIRLSRNQSNISGLSKQTDLQSVKTAPQANDLYQSQRKKRKIKRPAVGQPGNKILVS